MNTHHKYGTIVIGGGPGGSTITTLVAEQGHSVLLLERATTPQFKIGESLIPATYWTFKRLGMLEKLRASHFTGCGITKYRNFDTGKILSFFVQCV